MHLRFGVLGAIVALGVMAGPSATAPCTGTDGRTSVQLIFTAHGNGEIDQCGCKKDPKGGLAWRAGFIDSLRAECASTLVIDGGNWASSQALTAPLTNGFIVRTMADMGYDAMSIGVREINAQAAGPDGSFHHTQAAEFAPLSDGTTLPSVIESNLRTESGARVGRPYLTRDVGDARVGVFSLMSPNVLAGSQAALDGVGLVADDVTESAIRTLAELEVQGCDVVVLLARMEVDEIERLLGEVPGIDVVLMSHQGGLRQTHSQVGDAIVVRPGTRGQYVAWLTLELDANGSIELFDGRSAPLLIDEIPRDHATYVRVENLQEKLAAMKEQAVAAGGATDAAENVVTPSESH